MFYVKENALQTIEKCFKSQFMQFVTNRNLLRREFPVQNGTFSARCNNFNNAFNIYYYQLALSMQSSGHQQVERNVIFGSLLFIYFLLVEKHWYLCY